MNVGRRRRLSSLLLPRVKRTLTAAGRVDRLDSLGAGRRLPGAGTREGQPWRRPTSGHQTRPRRSRHRSRRTWRRPRRPRRPEPERRAGIWRRWSGWLVIAVPAAISLVVGGYEIGGPSLWRDEAYTKDAIARPFGEIFPLLGHQDAVHGAYYLLMHVIATVIGTSATALRLPSLCAMVIATGFTAAAGRRAAALARPPDQADRAAPRPGRPGADRAAVRAAVRDRAVHDVLRADGQVVRDRDDVRRHRHLPAAAGLARRPLAVVAGVRGGRGADRPVQHLRAADPGRARGHAAAERR